jgi:hypothetical protein
VHPEPVGELREEPRQGLGLNEKIEGRRLGTEFDIDDLIWMDTATRGEAAVKSDGKLSPNEQRKKFYGLGPITGGDSPLAQQQYYSLERWPRATRAAAPIHTSRRRQEPSARIRDRGRRRRRRWRPVSRDSAPQVAGGAVVWRVILKDWPTSSC